MFKSGYFNDNKKEFIITDMRSKRPLINYLWNDNYITNVDQFGFGDGFVRESASKRRYLFDNQGKNKRLVYLRNNESGQFYSCNRNYNNEKFEKYECHVGLGYQTIISDYNCISTAFTISVPKTGNGEMWEIVVKNANPFPIDYSLYTYCNPVVNHTGHMSYNLGEWNESLNGIYFSHKAFASETKYSGVFVKSDTPVSAYEVSDTNFIGVYGRLDNPEGLHVRNLKSRASCFDEVFAGILQFDIKLNPDEEKRIKIVVGLSEDLHDAINIADSWLDKTNWQNSIDDMSNYNQKFISSLQVDTPDKYINSLINIWLKRQISLGKTWGRVYSKGFRDIMQDIASFISMEPQTAKERIINCLEHQYKNGNTLRAYDPIDLHPYRDGASWIPSTILEYVKETGDKDFLNTKCKYYDSVEKYSVFEHTLTGLRFLLNNLGQHGLTIWGGGDWNDSINNTGMQLKGESVWLSIATVKAINDFCELLNWLEDKNDIIDELTAKKETLIMNIKKHGWDGDHFIYGFNDWDEKIGSDECTEGKIYLNPQTWAILAGITNQEESERLLETIEKRLKCSYGYVQNVPSYTSGTDHIGRITYFQPGCFENGSVYNHGVAFKIAAECKLNHAEKAFESLKLIMADNSELADSGVEPYVVTNMYLGPENKYRSKFAPYSWITGTAGWLYRCITENIIGIQPEIDGLSVKPCIPECWNKVNVIRIFRDATYNIEIIRSNENKILVDSVKIDGNIVPVFKPHSEHIVTVFIK